MVTIILPNWMVLLMLTSFEINSFSSVFESDISAKNKVEKHFKIYNLNEYICGNIHGHIR